MNPLAWLFKNKKYLNWRIVNVTFLKSLLTLSCFDFLFNNKTRSRWQLKPSFPMYPFSITWKHQKTLRFSDIFRDQRKGGLGTNGLTVWDLNLNKSHLTHFSSVLRFILNRNQLLILQTKSNNWFLHEMEHWTENSGEKIKIKRMACSGMSLSSR